MSGKLENNYIHIKTNILNNFTLLIILENFIDEILWYFSAKIEDAGNIKSRNDRDKKEMFWELKIDNTRDIISNWTDMNSVILLYLFFGSNILPCNFNCVTILYNTNGFIKITVLSIIVLIDLILTVSILYRK